MAVNVAVLLAQLVLPVGDNTTVNTALELVTLPAALLTTTE